MVVYEAIEANMEIDDKRGQIDELRKKIVATKEGGAITGEERLRENLADLFGNVNNYEGRPLQTQVDRADAIARELADVVNNFESWAYERNAWA